MNVEDLVGSSSQLSTDKFRRGRPKDFERGQTPMSPTACRLDEAEAIGDTGVRPHPGLKVSHPEAILAPLPYTGRRMERF